MIEWNDAVTGSNRVIRGGSWNLAGTFLQSSHRNSVNPVVEDGYVGFRVASVPEPSTYALLALAAAGWGAHWWRRKVTS